MSWKAFCLFGMLHVASVTNAQEATSVVINQVDLDEATKGLNQEPSANAERLLVRAGDDALGSIEKNYSQLNESGKEKARNIVDEMSCFAKSKFYLDQIVVDVERVQEKSLDVVFYENRNNWKRSFFKVQQCCAEASEVVADIEALKKPLVRSVLLRVLGENAPGCSIQILLNSLSDSDREVRETARKFIRSIAKNPKYTQAVNVEVARTFPSMNLQHRLEVLRALGDVAPLMDNVVVEYNSIEWSKLTFEKKYQLIPVAGHFARSHVKGAVEQLQKLFSDADWRVREKAIASSAGIDLLQPELEKCIEDDSMRVRVRCIQTLRSALDALQKPSAPLNESLTRKISNRLRVDEWTNVRVEAAGYLGNVSSAVGITETLIKSLQDPSPLVRIAVLKAMALRQDRAALEAIRELSENAEEGAEVRATAVETLATLCDVNSVHNFERWALRVDESVTAGMLQLSYASIRALGVIHPPQISKMLAPLLQSKIVRTRQMAQEAINAQGHCH